VASSFRCEKCGGGGGGGAPEAPAHDDAVQVLGHVTAEAADAAAAAAEAKVSVPISICLVLIAGYIVAGSSLFAAW